VSKRNTRIYAKGGIRKNEFITYNLLQVAVSGGIVAGHFYTWVKFGLKP
jgi:hypothetical protein